MFPNGSRQCAQFFDDLSRATHYFVGRAFNLLGRSLSYAIDSLNGRARETHRVRLGRRIRRRLRCLDIHDYSLLISATTPNKNADISHCLRVSLIVS
jgi:hypothetical protein